MTVPRQVHEVALFRFVFVQIPDRRHVGGTKGVVHREPDHEVLCQVHGIVTAPAPLRKVLSVDPGKLLFALEEPLLRDRDDEVAIQQLIEPGQLRRLLDLPQHVVGIEAGIFGRIDREAEERFEVQRMARSRWDKRGRLIVLGSIAGGMAGGAGVGDARESDDLLGKPDRQLLALLPGDAEGGVPAWARKLVGKHARQHVPDPVRHAGVMLRPDRSVLEAHVRGRRDPIRLRLLTKKLVPPDEAYDTGEHQQEQE